MLIVGEWRETATTVPRPYLHAHVQAHDGSWVQCLFLIDTGADCTVLAADVAMQLGLPMAPSSRSLGGVGGSIETSEVQTTLRLTGSNGARMNIAGSYATSEDSAVQESILGYDIIHLFALIVDHPGDTVCLIRPPHRYSIETS